MNFNCINKEMLFVKSALSTKGAYLSTQDILLWLKEQNNKVAVDIKRCSLQEMNNWYYSADEGRIKHQSGKFYSIDGIKVKSSFPKKIEWQQPIINQPEIGYLGIIVKKINDTLHFLLQAKIEPGNVNCVQLSPTLQATRSNYTKVHKGASPLYLEYFIKAKSEQILVDQLQSEQGSSFLHKRNRNIIIEITEDIKQYDNFIWLTLGQIKQLMKYDNAINMATRSVVSCAILESQYLEIAEIKKSGYHFSIQNTKLKETQPLHTINEIMTFFIDFKSDNYLYIEKVKLNNLKEWSFDDMSIYHKNNKYFEVIAIDVEINNREVVKWSQPMLKPACQGILVFLVKNINDVLHFVVQTKIESGHMDIAEFGPSVQVLTEDYTKLTNEEIPFIDLVINVKKENIIFDNLQSEEGGRFYQDNNRYMMIMDENLPTILPKGYIWMTLNQLQFFLKFSNFINIQARSLIANISYCG